MKKIIFLDRDGTIIREPANEQIDSFEKLEFLPGVISNLSKICKETDYELVMVTNQDGLGTALHPEKNFWPPHNMMLKILETEGVDFLEILIDKSLPEDNALTRKPQTGLLKHYIDGNYDLKNSFVIGDRITDIELAQNLNANAIFISEKIDKRAVLTTRDWDEIYEFLVKQPRKIELIRKTKETEVVLSLNLDGTGKAKISTGIGFFNHMLLQICKHGEFDISISVKGDLDVDEHHSIEDTALILGKAFKLVLGSKKGIQRYGFLLPMDDSLAQVAVDFGGRPFLVWNANFKREKVGDMPTEMFSHFFKSFSNSAKCNINIKADGDNEHHKIEAIFKAFAKAVKMAVLRTGSREIPSTKGTL